VTALATSRIAATALASLVFLMGIGIASADESSYCRKVHARARGDAALLFAPSLQAQAIKFPQNGTTDLGVTTGTGYQFRAALQLSLLDVYKGFRVLRAADFDCRQHDAVERAHELALEADDLARLGALRRQAALLDARRADWEKHVAAADERLARQLTTRLEAEELRRHAAELSRKREQVAGEIARLQARRLEAPGASPASLAAAVDRTALRYEREASHLRTLDAWSLTVTGGVIPIGNSVDYFGIVQLGFNLGGLVRYPAESAYLAARADEIRHARYETVDEVNRLRAQLEAALVQSRRERAIVDQQHGSLWAIARALDHTDAPNAAHARALVELQLISVESERVLLAALGDEISHLLEENHVP
jgi:hypothetical protein